MTKISKMVVLVLAIGVAISLLATPALASFWLKGMGFHYSPDYGELGKDLDEVKPYYDIPQVLESGTGGAFAVGYDFGNWGLVLDTFSFTGVADYHHKHLADTFKFETSTSPVLLSLVYRIPMKGKLHPYLGAGIGSFSSELTIESNIHQGAHYTDSPIGYEAIVGADLRLEEGLFFSGELRYLSAKAEYPSYRCLESCSTDWSGIFISIGVGYRFGSLKVGTERT